MKVAFYSNYLTHHQIPFCTEMYRLLKEDFVFVSNDSMENMRREQGWELKERFPYELQAKEEQGFSKALLLSKESDVIIIGSAPEIYVKERMRLPSLGITFRYSERIFKKGKLRFLSPRGLLLRADTYYRYRKKNLYMLCASAYTSADLMLQGSYLGKCYKWGYFPETRSYELSDLMKIKRKSKPEILWCGRFLKWKHPEAAILLAHRLKQEGFDFTLTMIGAGERESILRELIAKYRLDAYIKLLGVMSPEQVRQRMEEADIFLSTSDFNEGWGAVMNEAMNSGCAVVASHAVGAAPYLIKDGINGFMYKNGALDSLYRKVKQLLLCPELREKLGLNAYQTIITEWNAKEAAKRLLLLTSDLLAKGYSDRFESGPCSRALIMYNHWYRDKKIDLY